MTTHDTAPDMVDRETFAQFIERHPEYHPIAGELMNRVYQKDRDAFIAYVDEQVSIVLAALQKRESK
jgi:hypothetical protein